MDQKHIQWRNDVCFLDEEDREDPFSVKAEYCFRQTLFEVRQEYCEMFRVALENKHWLYTDTLKRADAFWNLMELIKVIEACYLLYAADKSGKFTYKFGAK
jgi:hypothetical protein